MIQSENVSKMYRSVNAVSNLTLNVAPGEIFGLVGPDGAGKTTTIRMFTGVIDPTSGRLKILGQERLEAIKGSIGYVPQKFSLYGDLTVIENIRFIGAMYGSSRQIVEDKAVEILDFTKLLPFKDRLADNLSGGMKQKLALAAGLMHKPQIFFLDEPTTGVDPVSRREFWQMLYRLNREGMTIFVSTPYMDEAELCTRVAFMHNGIITACASPKTLRDGYPYRILELQAGNKAVKPVIADCSTLEVNEFGDKYHLVVTDPEDVSLKVATALQAAGILDFTIKEIPPTMEDVFVALAGQVT